MMPQINCQPTPLLWAVNGVLNNPAVGNLPQDDNQQTPLDDNAKAPID